jgi:hypothetical protein
MKLVLIVAGCLAGLACRAQPSLPANFIATEPRSNVCLILFLQDSDQVLTNTPIIPAETRLGYTFASASSTNFDVFCLEWQYACLLSARSSSGAEVSKTRRGRTWGTRFFEVKAFDRKTLSREGGGRFPYLAVATPDTSTCFRWLPPLSELFDFDQPGRYTVKLVFQCFVKPWPPSSSAPAPWLVRFPPVTIHVEKSEEPPKGVTRRR